MTTQAAPISSYGRATTPRQVCVDPRTHSHTMPRNAVLPPHAGMILTRGLLAWCCLFPQELSFEPVARLLGWQTHEEKVLSSTTIRSLVRTQVCWPLRSSAPPSSHV